MNPTKKKMNRALALTSAIVALILPIFPLRPAAAAAPQSACVTLTGDGNVYDEQLQNVLVTYPAGEDFTAYYVTNDGHWTYVTSRDGTTGWVYTELLRQSCG